MIRLETNGQSTPLQPATIEDLRAQIDASLPRGEVICALRINGHEVPEARLSDFDLAAIRTVEVQSSSPRELARDAVYNTTEWIGRMCEVLESISQDYRRGRPRDGAGRLVPAIDALQILVTLLGGIHEFVDFEREGTRLAPEWTAAETALQESIEGLVHDLEGGDPERLADRTGHLLPRSLRRFNELLDQLPT